MAVRTFPVKHEGGEHALEVSLGDVMLEEAPIVPEGRAVMRFFYAVYQGETVVGSFRLNEAALPELRMHQDVDSIAASDAVQLMLHYLEISGIDEYLIPKASTSRWMEFDWFSDYYTISNHSNTHDKVTSP